MTTKMKTKAEQVAELEAELVELYAEAEEHGGGCWWCESCGNGEGWLRRVMESLAVLGVPHAVEWVAEMAS
jgi:hypothetical protein